MADAVIAGPPGRPHPTAGTTGTPTGPATYDGRSVPILCALVAALSVAATVLTVVAWNDLLIRDAVFSLVTGPAAAVYAGLGGLVVRRARNLIGWFLLGDGAFLAIMALSSAYAVLGVSHPGTLPAAAPAGLLAQWSFVPVVTGVAFMLLLFPAGTLPSRRWRPVAALELLATAVTMAGVAVQPGPVGLPAPGGTSLTIANPFGITSIGPLPTSVLNGTLNGVGALAGLMQIAACAALVVRYRSGDPEQRQQIKWITLLAVVFAICQGTAVLGIAVTGDPSNLVTIVAYLAVPVLALFGLPAVLTLAILKHGLYQIDVILNRAVKYGLLSASLTAVYAGIVLGIGTLAGYAGGPVLTVAAAVVIAVLFQSARARAQLVANRLVYGPRATPYQVLSDFAEDMAGQLDVDVTLDRMASLLAAAIGADRVDVWVRVGEYLTLGASWPRGSAPRPRVAFTGSAPIAALEATRAIAVRHGDEVLGAIAITMPRGEFVSAAEDKLLVHLASQAGLMLRNIRLAAELQATIDDLKASRRRLVRAQDTERQRIERNLHDGAQQQLIALTVGLTLLDDVAADPGEVRQMAAGLRDALRLALDDLRALARGIYPPLLADQGLAVAVRGQADRAPLPVRVEAEGIGRHPQDVEAATYFCVLEALQNVAKYAHASQATIALSDQDGHLRFSVTDDGSGFDTTTTTHGTGLQGMADRLAVIGGTLRIRSAPGLGTTISGTLPAGHQDSRQQTLTRSSHA